ncbi:MAG: hypothetical protein A2Y20_05055 [Firmicutes bacterium GWF2_51_9]|nr:MAG: hypothetical protein A2Y20_05055 [Firmicutes bacterium GWF2_51_9]
MKRILSLVLSIFILPVFCIPIIAAVPTILPDVIVTPLSLVVSENQTSATFSVYLSSEPTDDVTIPMVSSDSFELTIDRATITFTNNDYNIPQIVTVTGVDDDLIDGDKNVLVVLGTIFSTDVNYDGLNPTDVSVTVQDNEVPPEIIVTPLSLVVSENQTSATFSVYLSSEPTDDVTIPMVSSDSFELTIDRATITFTNNDYNIPQIVTVTGVDDDLIDGDKNVFVVLGTIFSYDVNYDGLNPTDVSVTVQDNDQVVTPLSIVSSNPEDGSLNVPWGVTLTITFSENIQVAENIGKVIIDNAGVLYGYTYKVRGTTLYLNPKGNFQYNSLCIITLPMGVVKSLSGSSISNDYSYSFRVKAKR